jgi:hypothetical protein
MLAKNLKWDETVIMSALNTRGNKKLINANSAQWTQTHSFPGDKYKMLKFAKSHVLLPLVQGQYGLCTCEKEQILSPLNKFALLEIAGRLRAEACCF